MITSLKHAQQVQARRLKSGKKGRSKAVRRWFKRTQNVPAAEMQTEIRLDANFDGCRRYPLE